MSRTGLSIFIPPLAVCRYGCAGCCAAPIAVFWLAGITGIIYGFMGGPAGLATTSWTTVLLGIALWCIASVWARTAIRGINEDLSDPKCEQKRSPLCRIVKPDDNDKDPMDEIKKFSS